MQKMDPPDVNFASGHPNSTLGTLRSQAIDSNALFCSYLLFKARKMRVCPRTTGLGPKQLTTKRGLGPESFDSTAGVAKHLTLDTKMAVDVKMYLKIFTFFVLTLLAFK